MMPSSLNGVYPDRSSQVLWEDGERVFCRGWRLGDDGNRNAVLVVQPAAEYPSPSSLYRLAHEYELKDELDRAWAVRPLELVRDGGRTMLVLEDPGGEPLDGLLGGPMEVERFLRLAIGIAVALGKLHRQGLMHKDIKPANILVNGATERWVHGVRHRLAPAARAADARAARDDRRHARLHGAGADWPDEPLGRLPKRPLRPGGHLLPAVDRRIALHRR